MSSNSSSLIHQNDREYSRWKILVVDADPTQRLIMARLLKRAEYDVETAGNGREALAKIANGDFQFVLTDWEMPQMDGIALCRTIRSEPQQGYLFTILLTARDAIEHVITGLQSGADDYLTKPVIEPELMARLNTGKRIVTLERSLRTANEANRRLAITDSLTGTYNRLYLMEQLPREISRAIRFKRHLSVIMCDIDDFKTLNDTYGHAAGGEVLAGTAALLVQGIRSSDWVATYGGDEFYVVLPETPLSIAHRAADILRRDVSGAAILPRHSDIRVTASFGVVGWEGDPSSEITAEDVLRTVDRCVYESKSSGRNRVTIQALPRSASAA